MLKKLLIYLYFSLSIIFYKGKTKNENNNIFKKNRLKNPFIYEYTIIIVLYKIFILVFYRKKLHGLFESARIKNS
jgi:hypothetical protein